MPIKHKNGPDKLDFTDIASNTHSNSKRMHTEVRVPRKNQVCWSKEKPEMCLEGRHIVGWVECVLLLVQKNDQDCVLKRAEENLESFSIFPYFL